MRRTARAAFCLLLAPIFATCGTDVVGTGEFIASIVVTPGNSSLSALGLTQQFSAAARDESGGNLSGKTFTWSSSAPSVVSIDAATGIATAVGNGTATIAARAEGIEGVATITIQQVVTSVTLTANENELNALQETTAVTASATDSEGNAVANAAFSWSSSAPSIISVDGAGNATALANGVSTISATANGVVGTLQLTVSQSPSQLLITQQPVGDVPSGSPLSQQPIVQVADANGHPVQQNGIEIIAAITSGGGTMTGAAVINTDASGAAIFTDLAIQGLPGIRVLLFSSSSVGASIPSGDVSIGAAPVDPSQSTATLSGSPTAGQILTLTISLRDASGNSVGVGGHAVVVNVTGANTVTPTVVDLGTGIYTASFSASVAGTNNVEVLVDGSSIAGSPFLTIVSPGAIHPQSSTATVPNGTANALTTIQIQARDEFGNLVTNGGASVVVSVTGANTSSPPVTDNGDGTYTASYTPTASGADLVAVTINGVPVVGSPFASTVSTGTADPTQSVATVPASGKAGVATTMVIAAADANGNAITVGGATVIVTVSGANVASPSVTDNGDGTYSASYTPSVSGSDNIAITLNGTAINSSPFLSIVAAGDASGSLSSAVVPASGTAGNTTAISIQAVDAFGNVINVGGAAVAVNVTGANSVTATVTDAGDGTYVATYTPTAVGLDNVQISIDGNAVGSSPYPSTISPGASDPTQSTAAVPSTGTVGTATSFTVTLRDANGNLLNTGGDNVVAAVTGANTVTPTITDNGDSTYAGNYTPNSSGTDNVAITLNGAAVSGSPFVSTVGSGAVDGAQSTAIVPAAGTAGSASAITIQARDVGGNAVTVGGATVVVAVSGANTATPPVIDNGNGTYVTSYTPTVAGADAIAITLNGVALSGSPFTSTIGAGAANGSQSTATVPTGGSSGNPTTILVQARDVNGNVVSVGGAAVTITISGANTATPTVTDNGDGTYSASYTPIAVGSDLIAITLDGVAVSGSPFSSLVGTGSPNASQSTATVPNGTAGSATVVTVQARDDNGNNLTFGGATVAVSVTGAHTVSPTVTDNGDGTYTASYIPTAVGTDNVAITLGGLAIGGSPYTSVVSPGSPDPGQTTATVPASGTAGVATVMTVQTRDGSGNLIGVGGEAVSISVSGANPISPSVTDNGDGSYSASYTPTVAGADVVSVLLNGVAISGSPFGSNVSPNTADAAQSSASLPSSSTAGATVNINVVVNDAFGNQLNTGGDLVSVSISGANVSSPTVVDNGDGTYSAQYTPNSTGTDNVAVTLNGSGVSGSPFVVVVGAGAADPTQTSAVVPSLNTAGNTTAITVQAKDANGNDLVTGGDVVVVGVTGANPGSLSVTDNGDGTYSASYVPTVTGLDNIVISINGTGIAGSPFASTVGAGNVDPAQSTASVPANGVSDNTTAITMQTRDANGNALTVGGATVTVTVTGANSESPTVIDNGDGTYSTSYIPQVAGTDNIAITVNGSPINGSPFVSEVAPGEADGFASTAVVPAVGTAGVVTNISVQARDEAGNALTSGGAAVVVNVSGANTRAPSVTDNGDGTYTTSYTPTASGTDNISITVDGTALSASPFSSTVAPGPLDPASSTGTVPSGTVGAATNIIVQARDGLGNQIVSGGETVVVTVTGANNESPLVTDVGDGTYTASYTPTVSGSDNVAITMNGVAISGSPFSSSVVAGSPDPSQTSAVVPGSGTAGISSDITVQVRDANGNPITTGGETVVVTVTGANSESPTVTDEGDGTYTASYTPTVSGGDNIAITLNGSAIGGSPFASTIQPGPADPGQSTANVPATGTTGVVTAISVQTRDANGNLLTTGGSTVAVTVSGANPGALTVTDVGDGTYTTSYTPSSAGNDNFAITLGGTAIGGGPYSSTVTAPASFDPTQSTAVVPAGTAGSVTVITITARDTNGDPMTTGGETTEVTITGANTANPTPTDNGDGTYTATYLPTAVGSDNVAITMNATSINGSPYTSVIGPGAVDAGQSTASVPGGSVGAATSIVVQARDANGNALTSGGAIVSVSVTGSNTASPAVTDNADGTYSASYTPTATGTDNVAITLDGTAISGSPYTSVVTTVTPISGKIAFDSDRDTGNSNTDVFIADEDGTNLENLTNLSTSMDERPSVSPDGTKIAFNSDRDGDHDIYVMNVNGTGVVQLTTAAGRDRHPVWSPDGTKILFLSERDGNPEVYVMDADGTNQTNLTNNSASDLQADWSPDGTEIVYYTSRDNDWFDLFTMNADGTNHQNILPTPGTMEVEVTWGVGGIVFVSNMDTGSNLQVYKIQSDGTGLTRLTNHANFDYIPAFNSDGTKIIFISNRTGPADIFIMNADGTGVTQITSDSSTEWSPTFQP